MQSHRAILTKYIDKPSYLLGMQWLTKVDVWESGYVVDFCEYLISTYQYAFGYS